MKITEPDPADYDGLLNLWEASVRATHAFLSESDIAFLKPIVRNETLPALVLRVARNNGGEIVGFIGVSGPTIEALFVTPAAFGQGVGTALIQYAEAHFGVCRVDVNEQNPGARAFYEHMGYRIAARSPLDAQGRAFPVLHLEKPCN